VGEKARVLEKRGRRDVIDALRKHDIAYHSDFHSVHPTPTEYLAPCGWLDGQAEFIRREGGGANDVRRIFSVPTLSCYGQPGSSWAPQAVAALKQIGVANRGIPCYVDEGDHVGLNQRPFWYAGALNVFQMGENCTRMELHDPAAVEPAEKKAADIAARLRLGPKGGLISIYYHPCEWVHRQFWDGVNFSRGANPPRERWQLPPQRSPAETAAAFQRFGQYIDFIRALPGVRFVVAADLPSLYPDTVRLQGAPESDLATLAARLTEATQGIDMQVLEHRAYSLADQMELLAFSVAKLIAGEKPRFPLVARGLWGPDNLPPSSSGKTHLEWAAFRDATLDLLNYLDVHQRVPSGVFVGADALPPADYLQALANVYVFYRQHGRLPIQEGVEIKGHWELVPARHVGPDTPGLFGGWVIHKEGFRAPKLLELARLQTWTLKPAMAGEQ
jgi:hypothetical protein